MPKSIVIAASLFGLQFTAAISGVVSTERRVQHYFGMPDYVGAVSENVNASVTRQLPRGSSRDDVERFLSSRGIGKDGVSECEAASSVGRITCRLAMDHHPWELLREDYTVSFEFDSAGKLQNVSVRSVFSGI
jgi:hypothetical protein